MEKIKLFIASSIDGYIADENDNIDWLTQYPNPDGVDYGYNDFFKTIDKVIIGRTTYEEILSFGIEWPYQNCTTYVVTTSKNYTTSTPNTKVINTINKQFIEDLKNSTQKDCWIVGGGKLITSFLDFNAIDEMTISLIPIMIGKGKKLFNNSTIHQVFNLVNSKQFDTGVINLTYKK